MIRSAALSSLPSIYNDFLYAPIFEDKSGMSTTVLSVLARQNVDPWEAAARLSRLPEDSAMRQLGSMIAALSGQSCTLADPATVAARLFALLPNRIASDSGSHNTLLGTHAIDRSPSVAQLLFFAICIGLMFFAQWMDARVLGNPRVDGAPASTLAQTPPSPIADKAHEGPR
jgi:hypothetical protein